MCCCAVCLPNRSYCTLKAITADMHSDFCIVIYGTNIKCGSASTLCHTFVAECLRGATIVVECLRGATIVAGEGLVA